MKTCTQCRETKGLTEFAKCRARKDGLQGHCRSCQKAYYAANRKRVLARHRAWYQDNKTDHNERARAWQQANPEKASEAVRTYQQNHPERRSASARAYYEANLEKCRARNRLWTKANPGKANAQTSRRRARKLRACPPWARNCPDIAKIYEIAGNLRKHGFDVHVDHIIPLAPRDPDAPRGLHVAANLQILPAEVNLRKHNSVSAHKPPDDPLTQIEVG